MSNLSNLFFLPNAPTTLPLNQDKAYTSYQQSSRPESRRLFPTTSQQPASLYTSNSQNIFKPSTTFFTSPLRRTQRQLAKTSLQNCNMIEQIDYFKQLSQQQFLKKSLIITIPLIILSMLGLINNKVCFQLILLGVSLLMNESLIIENKTLQLFIRNLPALTYTALFYDTLTEGDHGGHYYVTLANLPALIISVIATINFLTLKKLAFLPQQNLKSVQIHQKSLDILSYFYKSYIQRVKNNIKLSLYLVVLNLSLALIFTLYCLFNLQSTLFTQTFYTIPSGIIIFVLIDVFVYGVQFLAREITLFKLNKHFYQLQVCMSLLRLKSDSSLYKENSKIHQRCLMEIAKHLKRNSDYLETPVKVNYTINNVNFTLIFQYRDIFEIFASQQLALLHSSINENILKILRNKKILLSTKSMKEDALIHLRKIYARFENICLIFKILSQIQKRKLVFLIMIRLSRELPTRTIILETLNDVKESAQKATNVQDYFEIGVKKLKEWIRELETLKKLLRNEPAGMRVTRISQPDELGWSHYRRPNILDIQSI